MLGFLLLGGAASFAGEPTQPVKGRIDLSSTFCDFRPRHFHGGIDIRTNGTEGRSVYSPVDGYVWRIRYSYVGYGKGLYLKDQRGQIYVFGHLSRLSDHLEDVVKEMQYGNERYYLDAYFKADSIPVRQGELIAYSGQTGFGAPHLHFEKRTPDNMPLNPLTNGFAVKDGLAPEIKGLAFIYQDSSSLFPDGTRRHYQPARYDQSARRYVLDTAIFAQAPFGIAVKSFDYIRQNGPRLNIYRASLFIDDYLYYEVEYDTYDYAQTAMVDLSYDYRLAAQKVWHWHTLFEPAGKKFDGSKSLYEKGGMFAGRTQYSYGLHDGRIEVYDAAGNKSELSFKFVWAPPGRLLDMETVQDTVFYLNIRPEMRYIDIQNIAIYTMDRHGRWQAVPRENVEQSGGSRYRVMLTGKSAKAKVLRIDAIGRSGWRKIDRYVLLDTQVRSRYKFGYSLTGGGILFEANAQKKYAPAPRVDIVYEDGYIKYLNLDPVAPDRYAAYYRNNQIKSGIIRFDFHDGRSGELLRSKEVSLAAAGNNPGQRTTHHAAGFQVSFTDGCFYSPALMQIEPVRKVYGISGDVLGRAYAVGPTSVPLARSITVSFDLENETDETRLGLYRLNDKNKWKWVDSEISQSVISAESDFMGTFAVIEDTKSPRVKKIYPPKGKTVKTALPKISCTIED
ncbi:MAG: M23 family metallopeptidase, partial [Candidatus Zixiibacteriota bacterium]